MAVATFDGPNLRIILPSGQQTVDVESEIYSAWKIWALEDDNTKYPPAFRTVGGDPLTPGIEAGAYFFINNVDGWRIKPPEEDITIFLNGNLAPEDSTRAVIVPTDGAFTALVVNLQPVTQNVDAILEQAQETAYQGIVAIDTVNGVSGTAYPIGTRTTPVDNWADAQTIAASLGVSQFEVKGHIALDQDTIFKKIIGQAGVAEVDFNGQNTAGTVFERVNVSGDASANLSSSLMPTILYECEVDVVGITGFYGSIASSVIAGDISFQDGNSIVANCVSDLESGVPTFTYLDGGGSVFLNLRKWSGALNFAGMTNAASVICIDMDSGEITIEASVTAGAVILRGMGNFINNGSPGTVNKVAFVEALDVRLIRALDAGNVTITGSNPFVITVLDDDDVTVIGTWEVTPDGRSRTRTS